MFSAFVWLLVGAN